MIKNSIKTAVIGGSRTGKTSLCLAIAERNMEYEYIPTIGVDCMVKRIYNEDRNYILALWDLAGCERFLSIVSEYVKNSKILLFCYSSTSLESFHELLFLYKYYKSFNCLADKHLIVVATQIDSKHKIHNYDVWGREFCNKHNLPFIKTSAYENIGIRELTKLCIFNNIENVKFSTENPKPSSLNVNNLYKDSDENYCCNIS